MIDPSWIAGLGVILFGIGLLGTFYHKNAIVVLMCIELMLNAVNLTFVSLGNHLGDLGGQLAVFFVLVVAATEVVGGRGGIGAIMRRRPGATVDDLSLLGG